jgi:predicted acylesterase/phospholipase RssA
MRALVLSGGGSAGSWQCGAIKYLIEDLGIQYDIFTGVSVGALNAAWLAQYAKPDQKAGYQALYNLWYNIQDSTVKKNWFPWNVLKGLWIDSIYNSQPLIDLVHNQVSLDKIRASGNKIAVSATAINTGVYTTFTQDDGYFLDGILASSAFPMGLCPIVINGVKYTDGGVRHSTPITEAIQLGATDLDILICGPKMPTGKFDDVDVVTYGLRCFDYMTDQMTISDVKMLFMYNKLVAAGLAPDKKHMNVKIVQPPADLSNSSLSFDNATMRNLLTQGYNDAKLLYK